MGKAQQIALNLQMADKLERWARELRTNEDRGAYVSKTFLADGADGRPNGAFKTTLLVDGQTIVVKELTRGRHIAVQHRSAPACRMFSTTMGDPTQACNNCGGPPAAH